MQDIEPREDYFSGTNFPTKNVGRVRYEIPKMNYSKKYNTRNNGGYGMVSTELGGRYLPIYYRK